MNEFDTIFNKNNVELHHSLTNIEKKKEKNIIESIDPYCHYQHY
jgi:hypothetical protein